MWAFLHFNGQKSLQLMHRNGQTILLQKVVTWNIVHVQVHGHSNMAKTFSGAAVMYIPWLMHAAAGIVRKKISRGRLSQGMKPMLLDITRKWSGATPLKLVSV